MIKEELIKQYPWLKIKDDDLDNTWIDQMPNGWFYSFGELFLKDLDDALKESYPDGIPEDFRIRDIKEKWGTLRVYLSHEHEKVRDVLYIYEYLSSFVCLVCGAPYPFAHMTYDGWIMPLCERCYMGKSTHDFEKYHEAFLQTVLKDSITVSKGPRESLTIESFDGTDFTTRKLSTKETWEKIFQAYVERTIV